MQISKTPTAGITVAPFGRLPDGASVDIYSLRNANGLEARVCTYGGILVSLQAPDRGGNLADIVLGHDHLDGYLHSSPYFGALVGRCANRIAKGKFTLDGTTYLLAVNNGPEFPFMAASEGLTRSSGSRRWRAWRPARRWSWRISAKDGEEGYSRQPQCQSRLQPGRNQQLARGYYRVH